MFLWAQTVPLAFLEGAQMFERERKKKKKSTYLPKQLKGDVRCYKSYFLFSTSRALITVTILLLRYRCYINIYIHTQTKARDR